MFKKLLPVSGSTVSAISFPLFTFPPDYFFPFFFSIFFVTGLRGLGRFPLALTSTVAICKENYQLSLEPVFCILCSSIIQMQDKTLLFSFIFTQISTIRLKLKSTSVSSITFKVNHINLQLITIQIINKISQKTPVDYYVKKQKLNINIKL